MLVPFSIFLFGTTVATSFDQSELFFQIFASKSTIYGSGSFALSPSSSNSNMSNSVISFKYRISNKTYSPHGILVVIKNLCFLTSTQTCYFYSVSVFLPQLPFFLLETCTHSVHCGEEKWALSTLQLKSFRFNFLKFSKVLESILNQRNSKHFNFSKLFSDRQ